MAQSFWSKRKNDMSTAGGYVKSTSAVSRPTALVMTVLGIVVVGGLLFGIFSAARWSFGKLADNDTTPKPANVATSNTTTSPSDNSTSNTNTAPSVTATSSTSTTTPSATSTTTSKPATTTPAVVATANLPHTGPVSNTAVFVGLLVVSYLVYRKKLLKNQ